MSTIIIYQDYEVSQKRPTVKPLVRHFCFLQHIGCNMKLNYEVKDLPHILKLMMFTSSEIL